MNRDEKSFWMQICLYLFPHGHFSRVESGATASGIPDVDYCVNGVESHIELKVCSDTRKGVKLRDTQYRWFRERVEAGGHPVLLLKVIGSIPSYYLFYGKTIVEMKGHRHTMLRYWDNHADASWEGSINFEDLIWELTHVST